MKKIVLATALLFTLMNAFSQYEHHENIDVQHYNITLDISSFGNYTLYGQTEIIFQTTGESIDQIAFDLFKYTIDSVSFNGQAISSYNYNDTVFEYNPENPVIPGQNDTCTIFYHGFATTEPGSGWGGVHFGNNMVFNMGVAIDDVPHSFGRAWFPCIDNFTDRATYNINLITKDAHRGIATGILQEVVDYGTNKKMWKWQFNQTSPTYLISFAVGDFTLNSSTYEGANIDIPLEIYALPGDSIAAANTFAEVPEMLSLYENLFGPYHWEKAGYTVVNFSSGAMEHLTNIAYPANALSTDLSNQTLVAHELSHHWFGNLATCANAGEMWINEGWASYCEALYVEHIYGIEAYKNYVKNNQINVINNAHSIDGGYWALSGIPDNITYSTTVYDKGSMVVHNLRHYMGDDKFFPAVTDMLATYSENHISSEQMRDYLSNHSGIDLTGFFNNWVFNGGFPQYSITSVNENNSEITVKILQQSVGRDFIGDGNKVEVSFFDENWEAHSYWMEFDGANGSQDFSLDFTPQLTVLDLYNKTAGPVKDAISVLNNTDSYSPSGISFTAYPQEITDSVLMHVAQMWKGPKETGSIINEIEVLDIPWWRIAFNPKGDFSSNAKFTYNTLSLEDTLLNDNDTLMLVYRENNNLDWQIIEAEWSGNNTVGNFTIAELQNGNYAVARYREGLKTSSIEKKSPLKVWPNPSKNGFNIQIPAANNPVLHVFDMNGRLIDQVVPAKNTQKIYYNGNKLEDGQYTIKLKSDSQILGSCQIIKM